MTRAAPLDALIASPPFVDQSKNDTRPIGGLKESRHHGISTQRHYGTVRGQLAALREGAPATGRTMKRKSKILEERQILELDWIGLYDRGWGRDLVPAAFAHPAKVSRLLSKRIYDFMFEQDWLKEGDTCLDMFAGIGGFALEAELHGCNWIGIELEPRFTSLCQENIALWDKRYRGRFQRFGTARIVQGDSRRLLDLLKEASALVSSPPYSGIPARSYVYGNIIRDHKELKVDATTNRSGQGYGTSPGQLATLKEGDVQSVISSPPYAQALNPESVDPVKRREREERYRAAHPKIKRPDFGETNGQLANMPESRFSAAISSPPYAAARVGDECGQEHVGHNGNYGTTDGQLGAMAEGDAIVSSPPFQKSDNRKPGPALCQSSAKHHVGTSHHKQDVELSIDNLGNSEGETFWSASRIIMQQAFTALKPGAHAAFVCKRFVRDRKVVEFSRQWAALCESVGFEVVAWAKAWQTKDDGTQLGMDGNHKSLKKSRKGFFRRLHETKYPNTAIDWEDVIFLVKP